MSVDTTQSAKRRFARPMAAALAVGVAVTGTQVLDAPRASAQEAPKEQTMADVHNPIPQTIKVNRLNPPIAKLGIANLKDMPEGTQYSWVGGVPSTAKGGTYDAEILVTYYNKVDGKFAYDSAEKISVTIVVRPDNEVFEPVGKNIAVNRTEEAVARDAIGNIDELPVGTQFTWQKAPDTTTLGTKDATVVVAYPDGTKDTVKVKVVIRPDNEVFEPTVRNLETFSGKTVAAESAVTNLKSLPAGTKVTWKTAPDTSTPGDKKGVLLVTYPDTTTDTKTVGVRVYLSEEDFKDLSTGVGDVSGVLSELEREVDANKQDIKRANAAIEHATKEISRLGGEIEKIQKSFGTLNGDVTTLKNQMAEKNKQIDALEKQIAAHKETVKKNTASIAANKKAIADNTAAIAAVNTNIEKLTKDLDAQAKKVGANTKAVAEHKKAIDGLKAQAESLTKQLDEQGTQITAVEKRAGALEKRADAFDKRINSIDAEIKAIKAELERLDGNDIVTATRNPDNSITLTKKNGETLDVAGIEKYGLEKCFAQPGGFALALLPIIAIAAPIVTQSALPNLDKQIIAMQEQAGIYNPEVAKFIGDNRAALAAGVATAGLIGSLFIPGLCGDQTIAEAMGESLKGNENAASPSTKETHELNEKGRWVPKGEGAASEDADKADADAADVPKDKEKANA